jgi:hypothetical protein
MDLVDREQYEEVLPDQSVKHHGPVNWVMHNCLWRRKDDCRVWRRKTERRDAITEKLLSGRGAVGIDVDGGGGSIGASIDLGHLIWCKR